jgi:hypothetical protein
MRRPSFRHAEDVMRRAPPLMDERRPRHAAFEARPPREDRCGACLVAAIAASAACMALLVHYAPDILRGVAWVVVTLAVAAGFA